MTDPIWTKQDGETQRAYQVFCVYRDMGWQDRSLRQLTRDVYDEDATGVYTHVRKWSSKYEWVARAEAYDEHVSEQMREELEQQRIRDKMDRLSTLDALHTVLDDALEDLEVSDISPGMLEKLLKLTIQEKRKEYDDEPTQNINSEVDQVTTFELPDNGRYNEGEDHG